MHTRARLRFLYTKGCHLFKSDLWIGAGGHECRYNAGGASNNGRSCTRALEKDPSLGAEAPEAMSPWLLRLTVAITLAAPSGAHSEESPTIRFTDHTAAAGIDFLHVTGASGEKYVVETLGSGAIFFDYDGDLDPDLYLVNGGVLPGFEPTNPVGGALYRNDGTGRFSQVTALSGLDFQGYGMGAAAADYDNDGDPDLYVTEFGPNRLFRNNGDGSFTDVTEAAGLVNPLWGVSASWSDLDGDGNLDLYVANYLNFSFDNNPVCSSRKGGKVLRSYCGPVLFRGLPDALYRNRGDGTFEDVSLEAGVALSHGKGLGVVAFDYDGDGLTDLYVANDTVANFLFRNHGGMRFSEVGLESGTAYGGNGRAQAGMGVDIGDYDHDGDMDLFVTNFQGEFNTLYRNGENQFFTDVSALAGLARPSLRVLGFGTAFADLDNDGFVDLVVANGHIYDNTAELTEGTSYPQRNQLFWNRGDGHFEEITEAGPGFEPVKVSRGLAAADLESDGDLDLLFTNSGDRPDLLWNETPSGNSLRLLLIGRLANRDAVGAKLFLDLGEDERTTIELLAGSSYASQNERVVHIGLGQRTKIQTLRIDWPGSGEEVLGPLPAGELVVVVEGLGVLRSFPFR